MVSNTEDSIFDGSDRRNLSDGQVKPPDRKHRRPSEYDGFHDDDDVADEPVALTREQVQQLGLHVPDGVMEKQLLGQLAVGAVAALLVWLLLSDGRAVAAVAYGTLCSLLPAAFLAAVMRSHGSPGGGGGLLRFLICEAGRLLLSLGMLVAGAYGFGNDADKTALLCMVLTYIAVLKLGWVQMLVSVLPRRL